jgi:hypothetical protein
MLVTGRERSRERGSYGALSHILPSGDESESSGD